MNEQPRETDITQEQVVEWVKDLRLDQNARSQIEYLRTASPMRRVGGSGNVRGYYFSSIMGAPLQYEGHAENVFLDRVHHAHRTRMVTDQPCRLELLLKDADGSVVKRHHIPDFFWMSDSWAGYVECKPEHKLENACNPNHKDYEPDRYIKEGGQWRCPAAEKAAAIHGLKYRMYVTTAKDATLINNLTFLSDYYTRPAGNFLEAVVKKLRAMLRTVDGLEVRDIVRQLTKEEVDTFYFAAVQRRVYIDLENDPIPNNYTARVYLNEGCAAAAGHRKRAQVDSIPTGPTFFALRPGTKITLDDIDAEVVELAGDSITLRSGQGPRQMTVGELYGKLVDGTAKVLSTPAGVLAGALTDEAEKAWDAVGADEWPGILERYELAEPYLLARGSRRRQLPTPNRTIYRYIREIREAEVEFGPGSGILGLRHKKRKGRTDRRVDSRVEAIVNAVIAEEYRKTGTAPSCELALGAVAARCSIHSPPLTAPGRKFIYKCIRKAGVAEVLEDRAGPKAALDLKAPVWRDEWDGLSIEGNYAFALCHIDHTQLDIETPPTRDGLALGRPWLTVMISPRHGKILAMVLSYEEPSYRSCMAVVRECVRRHGRVPRVVVVDGGKEFECNYFRMLLFRLGCHLMFRPPATPRFGSKLERLIGTINSRLIHNMAGNTKLRKNVRQMIKQYDPLRFAIYSLRELAEIVAEFCYEFHDTTPNRYTGVTPRDAFEDDLRMGGPRSHLLIQYTEHFEIWSMPSTDKGYVTVDAREGVVINNIPYWHEIFRDAAVVGLKLAVRYNSDDLSTAYVHFNGKWLKCRCREYQQAFEGLTEKERNVMCKMIRQSSQQAEKRRVITARDLYEFIRKNRDRKEVALAEARAAANKSASTTVIKASRNRQTSNAPAEQPAPAHGYVVSRRRKRAA